MGRKNREDPYWKKWRDWYGRVLDDGFEVESMMILVKNFNPDWLENANAKPTDFHEGQLVRWVQMRIDEGPFLGGKVGIVTGFGYGCVQVIFEGEEFPVFCEARDIGPYSNVINDLELQFQKWNESDGVKKV